MPIHAKMIEEFSIKAYYKKRLSSILNLTSTILIIGGGLLFIPLLVGLAYGEADQFSRLANGFILPGLASIMLGGLVRWMTKSQPISLKDSMFICTVSWILLTIIGAVPYVFILNASYLDGCFETMSGFTTTGITVFSGLDSMPKSILFWRALTQWIGGLGILSMFILIGLKGGAAANQLFLAEGHKIATKKPSPGIFHTTRILWTLYLGFTLAQTTILLFLGLDFFDAITHAFTSLSTGGYSIYDSSIAHYRLSGFAHAHLIELTFIVFMSFGGVSFFIHYRFWSGSIRSLWDNTEMRYYWAILLGTTALILLSRSRGLGLEYVHENGLAVTGLSGFLLHLKDTVFQTISILTTTGYATVDINTAYFTAFAKQLFLVLMIVGGCAGSTAGGFKVIRVAILTRLVRNRLLQINSSRFTRVPLTIDNQIISDPEIKRLFVIFFMWMSLLLIGGGITAFFTDLNAWQSFSGMFSALGNIGPCYITVQQMSTIHPIVKVTYILGMLAGRLEIIPVLLIFSKRFYK